MKKSKLDCLAITTEKNYAFHSSSRINSRLIVLACEVGELERQLVDMAACASNARGRKAKIGAVMVGLQAILNKR